MVTAYWGPFRRHWWVWFVVVWANGDRERPFEDFEPWTAVREIQAFSWDEGVSHRGEYTADWLPEDERRAVWSDLGLTPEDF